MTDQNHALNLLNDVIAKAKAKGADAADAVYVNGTSVTLARRLGKIEHLERTEGADLGLRVIIGAKQAMVSSSDCSEDALNELVDRAVSMARSVPDDPYCGIAEPGQLAVTIPDLDASDPIEPDAEILTFRAACAEEAALAVAGVTNSEGAGASFSRTRIALAASNGFAQTYEGTSSDVSASVLAGEGTGMERDYDFTSAAHAEDLDDPEAVGRNAGERAVKRLNPRRVKTCQVPVIYDPRVSRSILGHLSSAINGQSVTRGTTFLGEKMGAAIFPAAVTIIDDPLRKRGMRSKPFDAEGIATEKLTVIENGVLKTWILDLATARQLELQTTGRASRGTSSPPSPSTTNLYMAPGQVSPTELIGEIKDGFYVTELIGFGVNGVTGDYSRGASGFWIENGELTYPVSEVTVAGNLLDIFAHITAADDLTFRYGTDAPTLRIDGMTVAGA